ncbi:outer membrane protein [Edaphobacter flagellatus]|uniref:outer membrane protein n=1 Tax=Edaphobacter flagellatus TaxID=1933044 RepID=UPI0021B257E7|nr:hypothetical protein [Edaphobacter flagellatus]
MLAKVNIPAVVPVITFSFVSILGMSPQASAQQLATNISETSSSTSIELPNAPEPKERTQSPSPHTRAVNVSEFNLVIGVGAQLTATRTANIPGNPNQINQAIQGTSPSANLFTSFHQQIRPLVGYNINFGYTRLSENYQRQVGSINPVTGVIKGTFSRGSIPTNLFEISSAYVVKRHQLGSHFEPFAYAGGGVLIFSPTKAPFAGNSSYRPTLLFGGGVDYRLSTHLGLRAEYRGLFYKYPDFGAVPTTIPISKFFTVTSEPTISIRYRFGYHKGMQ